MLISFVHHYILIFLHSQCFFDYFFIIFVVPFLLYKQMIIYEEDFYKRLPHTLENINLFMVERAKEKEELTSSQLYLKKDK